MGKDDDLFPGFQNDGEQAGPAGKPGAAPKAFDPFADVQVDVDAAPVSNPASAAESPAAAPPSKEPEGFNPFAGESVDTNADSEGGEVKPGSRKDLWKCPHCQAGNRPDRDTCRVCGKHKDAPVAKPWYANPVIIGPIAGVVVLLVVIMVMMSGPDLSLKVASPAAIDGEAQYASEPAAAIDVGGGSMFTPRGAFAITGRIVFASAADGEVILALGDRARAWDPDAPIVVDGSEVGFRNGLGEITPVDHVTLEVVSPGGLFDELAAGGVLSLVGNWGDSEDGGSSVPARDHFVVLLGQTAVSAP